MYDVFNVGTGEGTSVRQIVDEVKKVTGLPFTETVMPRRAGDPPHLIGSPKRINEEMGWHAKYNVEDIVKSAWEAWQANPEHHIDVETWKQARLIDSRRALSGAWRFGRGATHRGPHPAPYMQVLRVDWNHDDNQSIHPATGRPAHLHAVRLT